MLHRLTIGEKHGKSNARRIMPDLWPPSEAAERLSLQPRLHQAVGIFQRCLCALEITPDPDPYEEQRIRWERNAALFDAAVAGDAEAAITYCRMIKSGEINFAAMG